MKIVVRAPNWLGDIVMSLPFLYALPHAFPGAKLMVIIKPAYAPLLQLLPHPVESILFHKRDSTGLAGIIRWSWSHREARRADVYFCLPPSFSSAFMGLTLTARARVGYTGEGRDFLLTQRTVPPARCHLSQEYVHLLTQFTRRDLRAEATVITPKLEPLSSLGKPGRYIVVNPNSQAASRLLPRSQWLELLNSFHDQHFLFIGAAGERDRTESLLSQLSSANSTANLAGKTDILELARLLAHSLGVITNDSGPAHLAAYVGARVAVTIGAADLNHTVPSGPDAKLLVLTADVDCSPCVKNECRLGTLDCLRKLDMADASQRIQALFGLEPIS